MFEGNTQRNYCDEKEQFFSFFIPHSESPISIMLFHINTSHFWGCFLISLRVRYHLALLAD